MTDHRRGFRIQRIVGVVGLRIEWRKGGIGRSRLGRRGLDGTRMRRREFDGYMLRLKENDNSRLIQWELGSRLELRELFSSRL